MNNTNRTGGWRKPLAVAFWSLLTVGLGILPVQAGIANTKHNLSASSAAGNNKVSAADANGEICVFCHTPHAAAANPNVPLWNKAFSTATYTTYSAVQSSSIEGEILAVGSISLACLSCHDGTQAMDNIVNAPGSGGLDPTGGGATGLIYTWDTSTGRVNAAGQLTAASVANLGPDLSNDHPIGIQYCGGGVNTTALTGPCSDPDFVLPQNTLVNSTRVFWIDNGAVGAGTRNKFDFPLYTRTFSAGAGGAGPSVECGSCHDPHADPTVAPPAGTPAPGPTFLRVANTGSAVCLACHVK